MMLFFMMADLPTDFVQQFVDFFTALLVTIPSYFISETLNSGIFYDVWQTLFAANEILQVMLILALILGVRLMLEKQSTGRMKL